MSRISVAWHKTMIAAEKQAIKTELDAALAKGGEEARREKALEAIRELEDDITPKGKLRRFIYIVSLLFHYRQGSGLGLPQVRKLADVAEAILRTQGVQPGVSTLAFLYGELHVALSQIYRKEGQHWVAAWEQNLSGHLSQRDPIGGAGFQALATGIQSARLGHSRLAVKSFVDAEAHGLPPSLHVRSRLERTRALRLAGDLAAAHALAAESAILPDISDAEKRELAWEQLCCRAQEAGDIAPLMAAVRRGKSHYEYGYVLEASFWARSVETKQWLERVPKVKSITRNPALKPPQTGLFHKCAAMLEECYQYRVPFDVRLNQLGKILPRISQLVTMDKELLVWSSMARWLARSRAFTLAAFALGEYQALSLKLTAGKKRDALGVLGDVLERDWFRGMEADIDAAA